MDLTRLLDHETDRFVAALADVSADAPVPTCPGWTAIDLVHHLAAGQRTWAQIVAERRTAPVEDVAIEANTLPASLDALREAQADLRAALEVDTDEPFWSWHESGGTRDWVRRRMAHEALVHRLDAEATAGSRSDVDTEAALDGIDELLTMYVTGVPDWAAFHGDGVHVRLAPDASDRVWTLELGRMHGTSPSTGTTHDLAAAMFAPDAHGDCTVAGPAADVHAWLWGRGDLSRCDVAGETALAPALRALVADATQ